MSVRVRFSLSETVSLANSGCVACVVVAAAWRGTVHNKRPAQVFVDLHPGVGSFFDGWLQMRAKTDLAMYYMAFPECEVTVEWLKVAKTAKISGLFQSEVLPIQGFTTKIDENPNLSEKPPAPPRLRPEGCGWLPFPPPKGLRSSGPAILGGGKSSRNGLRAFTRSSARGRLRAHRSPHQSRRGQALPETGTWW